MKLEKEFVIRKASGQNVSNAPFEITLENNEFGFKKKIRLL